MPAGGRQAASASAANWTVTVEGEAVLRDWVDRMWAVLVAAAAVLAAELLFEHDDLA